MKNTSTLLLGILLIIVPLATARQPDALDEALELVGLRRADLGWVPKGWWPRYPDVPYKLRAFDALFAEPLDTITYARALAQTAWEKLDPAELAKPDAGRNSRSLFQAVQRLGIDPKFGGFRGYTANVLGPELPLDQAILKLYEVARRSTKPHTFGMDLPYPKIQEELAERVQVLPKDVSPILGQLVLNIIDAHYWVELAFRKVDAQDLLTVSKRLDVGMEMIDAYDYCPAFDDVAKAWDEASMWYAAQKCVDALDLARIKLQELELQDVPDFEFEWETPWGWIHIAGSKKYSDLHDSKDYLLLVDLDGVDWYPGGIAAASPALPISLCLDLAGNDKYFAGHGAQPPQTEMISEVMPAGPPVSAQGAGICGVGVLMDVAGDDKYYADRYAQGVGQFGLGLLVDLGGHDSYALKHSGQGCGYFGIGLLFDVAGNDTYRIHADGQGLGGVAGVGILADRTGNDEYIAERKHSVTGRPSYHSPDLDVAVSNVQGCGMGRRGDGADGHSWAGGLGALLDGEGDDVYTAGNWCMGTGYWFGIGVLHDRGGNDEYHGVVYSQGTGAHFCIGALVDEAGDDKHLAEENSNSSLAWAHDFTIGLLLDAGGDDLYSVDRGGLGYSINRSVAMLLDLGGNDAYQTKEVERPGFAENKEAFRARDGVGTYFADTTSVGLFLDIGGEDKYWGDLKNNTHWLDPEDSPNWADRNFSVGVDRPDGSVNFQPRPVKPPTGPKSLGSHPDE